MITNLPLLFVKGKPTSLSKMSIYELECFITFLVHCSLGHDTVKSIQQPPWWPSNVPFSSPFIRPSVIPKDWDSRLRELVKLCYRHHCSEFLLKFCEELSNNPPSALQYVKHCDSTTSLYLKSSHRLLVTFRNENMLYDDPLRKKNAPGSRKCLLPYRQTTSESIVESEGAYLYLCDTCDKVFDNLEDVQKHEKICSNKNEVPDIQIDSLDICEAVVESELIKEDDQDGFLHLFGLQENSSDAYRASPIKSDFKPFLYRKEKRVKRTLTFNGLTRFPFSSPAGLRINKTMMQTTDMCLKREHLERYCATPLGSFESQKLYFKHNSRHFPVKYRRPDNYWTRYQVFPEQRNKLILDLDSQLLFLQCKPLSVVLNRLSVKDINRYKRKSSIVRDINDEIKVDNDIEFVSHIVLPENLRIPIINKRKGRRTVQDTLVKKSRDKSLEVIDLCSDEDEPQKVVSPVFVSCEYISNKISETANSASISGILEPLNKDIQLKNAQYHINMQSATLNKSHPENTNSDPICVNIYSSNINNVISLD